MRRATRAQVTKRAQLTLEFMVVMGFAFILLVSLLGVVAYQLRTSVSDALAQGVEDIVATVEIELTTASVIGEGYETTFTLPQRVQGLAYTIVLAPDANYSVVSVSAGAAYADRRVPLCAGSIVPGRNLLRNNAGTLTCAPQ
jgi:hypothetical protein